MRSPLLPGSCQLIKAPPDMERCALFSYLSSLSYYPAMKRHIPKGSQHNHFTRQGTVCKTLFLLVISGLGVYLTSRWTGWEEMSSSVQVEKGQQWLWQGGLAALGLVAVVVLKPDAAVYIAPFYAFLQGALVGILNRVICGSVAGWVVSREMLERALLLTAAMLLLTSFLSLAGVLRMGKRSRTVLYCSMAVLLATRVSESLWKHGQVQLLQLWPPSWWKDAASMAALALACTSYLDYFQQIGTLEKRATDKKHEWYWAFLLLMSILWVYLRVVLLLIQKKEKEEKEKKKGRMSGKKKS